MYRVRGELQAVLLGKGFQLFFVGDRRASGGVQGWDLVLFSCEESWEKVWIIGMGLNRLRDSVCFELGYFRCYMFADVV